ncbi:hypothetical protein AOLI_G00016570 [Acnodon oligacanthus]
MKGKEEEFLARRKPGSCSKTLREKKIPVQIYERPFLPGVDMYSKDYNDHSPMHKAVTKDKAMIHMLLQYETKPLRRQTVFY